MSSAVLSFANRTPAPDAPVVVVSGLPRSGTSLVMAMLKAGGLPIMEDGKRQADADNPNGYFELEATMRLRTHQAWLAEAKGQAVKIVVPLILHLPAGLPCRVILLQREIDEVVASQAAMLARKGLQTKLPAETLKSALQAQGQKALEFLIARSARDLLVLAHHRLIRHPAEAAAALDDFLQMRLDRAAMAAVVDERLYRQRKSPDSRSAG